MVKKLLSNLEEKGENSDMDEFEKRYEEDDMVWLADFSIQNLILIKTKLCIEDDVVSATLMNGLFKV